MSRLDPSGAGPAPFGGYIVSHLPNDPRWRSKRKANFERQLRWWLSRTSVRMHVYLENWQDREISDLEAATNLAAIGEIIHRVPARPLILNRIACLQDFYASDFDWGVMMDDDAILYDPGYNSGSALFAEMGRNGVGAYRGVDVLFPANPAKYGFNSVWAANPRLYADHHVSRRDLDLKGSMFVLRNFTKQGRRPVLPNPNFAMHGEDTLFAIEAAASGYTVMRCWNVVLKELNAPSHFGSGTARKQAMAAGNQQIASLYGHVGLKMATGKHTLNRTEFLRRMWGLKAKTVVVPKP